MNRSLIDEALGEAKALGIRNILALRGDPPRSDEYRDDDNPMAGGDSNEEFTWAIDLVRYIRRVHGDYFCIGVAAYPEGHADESYPEFQAAVNDIPYLVEKTKAGADFIMTQLFYDVDAYTTFEQTLRNHESGVFKDIPIIPGLMPIQSYQILRRTTKLSHAKLPPDIVGRLDPIKGDDEAVKSVGVDIVSGIVEGIKSVKSKGPRGFHFYTLNLEKAVTFVLERCQLIPPSTPDDDDDYGSAIANGEGPALSNGINAMDITNDVPRKDRRRLSSVNSGPRNRVVVDVETASSTTSYEALADEVGVPKEKINSRANTLAISEGEGALGREATWDDYPNGRWGDARSPAYGEIDGYGVSLHVSISHARSLWGTPTTVDDISNIFVRHLEGRLEAIPWSEAGLNEETSTIRAELLSLIRKGWWTVASQPAVNGIKSDDKIFGWGPRGGFVFQKAFVELFLPASDWNALKKKLSTLEDVSFYAGNAAGNFESSSQGPSGEGTVNAVTWGAFPGKEIITPTIIEEVSFRAWMEEAFGMWREWQRVYPPKSETSRLLERCRNEYWLVNVIHHAYVEPEKLWQLLNED